MVIVEAVAVGAVAAVAAPAVLTAAGFAATQCCRASAPLELHWALRLLLERLLVESRLYLGFLATKLFVLLLCMNNTHYNTYMEI